jgi:hypothetical protein
MAKRKEQRQGDDALTEMRSRYELTATFHSDDYASSLDDVRFVDVPGNQWDPALKKRRGNRATYEFPKLRLHTLQIVNEMRQSRPQGKVRGVEESDRGLAEIMQGLCRNIESMSNADRAYDVAYDFAVKGGFGDWRICTDYLNDDDFEQDIRIKPIRNPFASKPDPAAIEMDRRDARFWFVEDLIPKSEFERKYPDADLAEFESDTHCQAHWKDADNIRVCEYWYKEPMKRRLLALSDGRVVFLDDIAKQAGLDEAEALEFLIASGVEVKGERAVDSHKVFMRLTNGREWLTEPYEFPSKYIPIVRVWGNLQNIEGRDYYSGAVRFAKDQQRLHNVHKTAGIEAVAKSPKAPFMVALEQIEGFEPMWKNANAEDYPYLPYKNVSGIPPPQRTQQAEVPVALIQLAQLDNEDIKAATGIYDASLGARSNETSGRAINARKQQGATATFNYIDNLAYSIRYSTEILVDMIPRVYDTPRVVRTLGEDGGEKWKQLYEEVPGPDGQTIVLNDIRKGKYDAVVTVGPSYATQRMEAAAAFAEMAGQIGNSLPALGPLLSYAVIKNQDLPGMEEIDTAIRKVLVQQGLLPPKEGEEPPPPPPPDPRMEADARKAMADAAKSEAQAAQAQAAAQMTPFQIQKLVAETVAQQLQNLQMGGQMFGPPPMQQFPAFDQPPQGGFFTPDGFDQGPQFTG